MLYQYYLKSKDFTKVKLQNYPRVPKSTINFIDKKTKTKDMFPPKALPKKKNLFDENEISPEKLDHYRSTKPLKVTTNSTATCNSDSKRSELSHSEFSDLFLYNRHELEDIVKKILSENPYLIKDLLEGDAKLLKSPFYNLTGLKISMAKSDQHLADALTEEKYPGGTSSVAKAFQFDAKETPAGLKGLANGEKNVASDDEIDNLVVINEKATGTVLPISASKTEGKEVGFDTPKSAGFLNVSGTKSNGTYTTPSKELIQSHLSRISEQLTSIKKERDSLKDGLMLNYKKTMQEIADSFHSTLDKCMSTMNSDKHEKKSQLLTMKSKLGEVKQILQQLHDQVPNITQSSKADLEALIRNNLQSKFSQLLGSEVGFVDPDAREYLRSLNKMIEWHEARKKIANIISASKKNPNQKRASIRRTTSPLELTPAKPAKKKQKGKVSKQVTSLIAEGLRYLLKSNPKMAQDEETMKVMVKQICEGSADLSDFLPSNKTRAAGGVDYKELSSSRNRKKQKMNPDSSQETNMYNVDIASGKTSVAKDDINEAKVTTRKGLRSGKVSVNK